MATLQELLVKIGVDADDLDKGITDTAGRIDSSMGRIQSAGEKLTSVGTGLTAGVTTPLVGVGVAALKTAGDFESSMNNVRAVTGATGGEFDKMSDLAREMGSTTQFSASESADAMQYLGMAGLDTSEIMEALPGTLSLAAAGGMELADAADVSTNVLAGMNMEVSELGHLNDVLADASRSANTDVQQLGMGMKQVAPVASGLGFELEETTAALGMLADAGIQGEQGGTLLRSVMSQLINPTAQAGEKLEALGVQATEADGSARPLADIMRDFEAAGADASDMMQIFGTEAGPAMIALLNRGGDELESFETQLQNSAGTAEEMADIKMEGLNGQLKELQSASEGLLLAIAGSGLLEWVTSAVGKVTEWTQSISETNPQLLKWGTLIGGIVAAVGPMLIVLGMVVQSLGQLAPILKILTPLIRGAAMAKLLFNAALWASPITWIIMGIIALIAVIVLIIVYWDQIKAATASAWDWIVGILSDAWAWIVDLFWSAVDWLVEAVNSGLQWLLDLFMNWHPLGIVISHWDAIVAAFQAGVDWAVNLVMGLVDKVLGWLAQLAQLPGMIGSYFKGMYQRAQAQARALLSFVRSIPGRIKSGLGNLGNLLRDAGRRVIQGLINGIKSMISNVGSAMSGIASKIRSYLPFSPAKDGPLSGSGAPEVSGSRIAETLGEGVLSELAAIDKAAAALMAPLDDRLTGIRGELRDTVGALPSNVSAAVRHSGSGSETRVVIDVTGGDGDLKRMIRKMVRTDGRGDVQQAFGR